MKDTLKKTLISLAVGLLIVLAVLAISGAFSGEDVIKKLCDGFFVAGVVQFCIAVLQLLASKGEYDGLAYIGNRINIFKRSKYINYGDYKNHRIEEREKATKTSKKPLFISAAILLAISIIFLIIFYV